MEKTRQHHKTDEAVIKFTAWYKVTTIDVLVLGCFCHRSDGLEDILR
jgi:hypothetical protein